MDDVPLKQPTEMVRLPGTDRWVVVEVSGKIVSFSKSERRDLQSILDVRQVGFLVVLDEHVVACAEARLLEEDIGLGHDSASRRQG